jgi:hypothetical protein
MQFLREEREERKYIQRGRTKNKKKEIAPYLARANLPPPRNTTKKDGIRFTNQRRRGDKKEDRRPEEDHHGQEGALASLSRGWFSDRIPIFFFRLSRPKWFCLLQREEKKRDQKTNQKSATFASSRLCAFAPQNRPFDAVKRAHRTPKCTGSTSVRALTPQHPSRAGREEDLSSGVCVFEKQKSKEICKVSFIEDASIAQKPTSLDDGKKTMREERFCFWSDFDLFFGRFASKKRKNTPKH